MSFTFNNNKCNHEYKNMRIYITKGNKYSNQQCVKCGKTRLYLLSDYEFKKKIHI